MLQKIIILSGILFIAACGQRQETGAPAAPAEAPAEPRLSWKPPLAGTVVDKYEKPVTGTRLYNAYFRVSVLATDSSLRGHYMIKAEFGGNIHEIPYELPAWSDDRVLKPVVKADTGAYACLVGFDSGSGAFRPYYRIDAQKSGDMNIKQVATYMLTR